MNQETSIFDTVESMAGSAKTYLEERLNLEILKGADKISRVTAMLSTLLMLAGLGLLLLLFLLIGLSLALNEWLQSSYAGYFVVSGLLLLIMVLLFTAGRKRIRLWILNYIVRNMEEDE
ncbi:MAG TPA: hypothetical protein VFS31_04080 [Chitinophagaceae bacterium]|jgi:hypothetical protein|nr:hypothetical protein [Chitinophagaceae bacterium]